MHILIPKYMCMATNVSCGFLNRSEEWTFDLPFVSSRIRFCQGSFVSLFFLLICKSKAFLPLPQNSWISQFFYFLVSLCFMDPVLIFIFLLPYLYVNVSLFFVVSFAWKHADGAPYQNTHTYTHTRSFKEVKNDPSLNKCTLFFKRILLLLFILFLDFFSLRSRIVASYHAYFFLSMRCWQYWHVSSGVMLVLRFKFSTKENDNTVVDFFLDN